MRVLVRVRGTAPAGESVLVTEGARGEHVTLVQDASPSSSRSRTYAFDQVLSAEADQNMVYTEAIGSVLDDVLLGYHCTISRMDRRAQARHIRWRVIYRRSWKRMHPTQA